MSIKNPRRRRAKIDNRPFTIASVKLSKDKKKLIFVCDYGDGEFTTSSTPKNKKFDNRLYNLGYV